MYVCFLCVCVCLFCVVIGLDNKLHKMRGTYIKTVPIILPTKEAGQLPDTGNRSAKRSSLLLRYGDEY